jgi:drug/metabolite transporter (DMT)-like permease
MAATRRTIPGWSSLPVNTRGIAWMCGATVCYAALYATLRQLTAGYSPLELIFLRSAFCTLFMLPWLARAGLAVLRTPRFKLHACRMTATYVAGVLWVYGLAHLPMADVTALNFTSPLFVVVIAMVFLGDRGGLHRWVVLGLGFAGILIILRPGVTVVSIAALLTLASACMFAVSHSITKAMASTEPPNLNVFFLYGLQSIIALVPALFAWKTPGPVDLAWIVAVSLCTLGAQQCIVRSLTLAPASLVMPFNFLQLPLVALAGLALYDEVSSVWTWVGAAVIFAAAYDLARRESRARRS